MSKLNVLSVTLAQATPIIKSCIALKQALLMHSKPGIGKSELVAEIADELGMELLDLRLAQFPPEDLAGLPVPVEKQYIAVTKKGKKINKTKYVTLRSLPDFLPTDPKSKGILFLDEVNQTNASVLHAIFELILSRRLSACNYFLPEGWCVLAACNDYEDNPDITEFSRPLNNRFLHLHINVNVKDWINWAKENEVNDISIRFAKSNTDLFDVEDNKEVCFCSPRTFTQFSKFEDMYAEEEIDLETLGFVAHGLLGNKIAERYMTFTSVFRNDKLKNLDMKKVLLGKADFDFAGLNKQEIDVCSLQTLLFQTMEDGLTEKQWIKSFPKYVEILADLGTSAEVVLNQMTKFYPEQDDAIAHFRNVLPDEYKILIKSFSALQI